MGSTHSFPYSRFTLTTHTNPYAQPGDGTTSAIGALPSLTMSSQAENITLRFKGYNTTILNSTVQMEGREMYTIVTDHTPPCTIIKDDEKKTVARIRWQPHASVEIRDVLPSEQRVREWLMLSEEDRTIVIAGVVYRWKPTPEYICLYKANDPAPKVLALFARLKDEAVLEITKAAIGLLEPAIVATVLLLSGNAID